MTIDDYYNFMCQRSNILVKYHFSSNIFFDGVVAKRYAFYTQSLNTLYKTSGLIGFSTKSFMPDLW